MPKTKLDIVTVPKMNYLAVRGSGDPNVEGYFDYVVPPLEGFWQQKDTEGIDYSRKEDFCRISPKWNF